MKKVSIVVPIYNVETYLRQCILSLLQQTYTDLEIILVDDGSTDKSGSICDEYAQEDDRIKVIHQQNAGAANAKNAGIEAATGEYLTFIDSDDYVDVQWISVLVNELEKRSVDLIECGIQRVYTDHTSLVEGFQDGIGFFTSEQYMEQYFQKWTNSLFWNKLFKRVLTDEIRFRTERRCIDDEFYTYKILCNASSIYRIEEPLYYYRQRASSAVQNRRNLLQITRDALEILIERYEWVTERYPSLKKKYIEHDIDFLLYFCYQGLYDEESIRQYRRVARYYLIRSLGCMNSKIVLANWFRLLVRYPSIKDPTDIPHQTDNLFK